MVQSHRQAAWKATSKPSTLASGVTGLGDECVGSEGGRGGEGEEERGKGVECVIKYHVDHIAYPLPPHSPPYPAALPPLLNESFRGLPLRHRCWCLVLQIRRSCLLFPFVSPSGRREGRRAGGAGDSDQTARARQRNALPSPITISRLFICITGLPSCIRREATRLGRTAKGECGVCIRCIMGFMDCRYNTDSA